MQSYGVTLLHNKHVSGYQFYFDTIGKQREQCKFKFNPELNHVTVVEATSPQEAVGTLIRTEPFLAYLACKYREISNAEDYLVNPKKVAMYDLQKKYNELVDDEAVDVLYDRGDANRYYEFLDQPEIREQFTDKEYLLLKEYGAVYYIWRPLVEVIAELYGAFDPQADNSQFLTMTPKELDHLVHIETTYGSIEVHPV